MSSVACSTTANANPPPKGLITGSPTHASNAPAKT